MSDTCDHSILIPFRTFVDRLNAIADMVEDGTGNAIEGMATIERLRTSFAHFHQELAKTRPHVLPILDPIFEALERAATRVQTRLPPESRSRS